MNFQKRIIQIQRFKLYILLVLNIGFYLFLLLLLFHILSITFINVGPTVGVSGTANAGTGSKPGQPAPGTDDKINLDAPDLLLLEDDEERKSDEDDTRRFTIKDFKDKAQKFVKDNFDKYAAKKKPKTKTGAGQANNGAAGNNNDINNIKN